MSAPVPGTIRFKEILASPSTPPAGYAMIYVKTDEVLYLKDSSGTEVALGSASSITQLTGEVTAIGPGIAAATISNSAVIGKVLTGFSASSNSTILASDTILQAFQKAQTQINATNGAAITSLTGDVSATGPGAAAATVNTVGGSTASNINLATIAANAATSSNTASTIVKRDASGNFSAGVITAALSGNATTATTATNFSGSLSGDVTGTQSTTVVSTVGGKTAAQVSTSVDDTLAATSANTASTIVKRDASGNFSAGTITASLTGNATNVTGVVAIANGGTNSSSALSNNRIMKSSGGSISEAAIITPARALISDANGIPTQSAVTSTELGYVSGVTSSIQTQLNSITGSAITALTGDITATGPGSVTATIGANIVTNAKLAQMPATTLKGNNTAGTANASDLTVAQVNTMLGTVTSVSASTPLQSNGGATPTISFINQSANTVLAGPTTGGAASPTFRALVAADILPINLASTSNGGVTGTLPIANGGTNSSTALNNNRIMVSSSGAVVEAAALTNGQLLIGSTGAAPVAVAVTAGTGVTITNGAGSITVGLTGLAAVTTKTANYTILSSDSIIFVDSSGGAFTLTLPSPAALAGKIYRIIDTTGNLQTNNVTLARSASEKIEGLAASKLLQTAWGFYSITTNGTDWYLG